MSSVASILTGTPAAVSTGLVPAPVALNYNAVGSVASGTIDIFDGAPGGPLPANHFVQLATIPIPAAYQAASVYSVSLTLSADYSSAGPPVDLILFASATIPTTVAGGPAPTDSYVSVPLGSIADTDPVSAATTLVVANAAAPVANIYVYITTAAVPAVVLGVMNNVAIKYSISTLA